MKVSQNLVSAGQHCNIEEIQECIGATIDWTRDRDKSTNELSVRKYVRGLKQ